MYLKRKRFLSFQYKKIHLDLLKTPSPSPIFSARNTISARSTPMHLVYKKKYSFCVYSIDNQVTNKRRSSYRRTALNS